MTSYICNFCKYTTKYKSDYNKHLKTLKHKRNTAIEHHNSVENDKNSQISSQNLTKSSQNLTKSSQNLTKSSQNLTKPHKISQNITNDIFKCKYCSKKFNRKDNLDRHLKHYCKEIQIGDRTYSDLQKIIKIQEIEIENHKKNMETQKEYMETKSTFYKAQIDDLRKQIEELLHKNRTTIINIDKQINLNNYGNEDLSHISDSFKDQMLKIPFVAIPKMIEEVHFSDKKPENKNIKMTNKKENYLKVYKDNKWVYKDKKSTITQLMGDKYSIIDDHYKESQNLPQHIDKQYSEFKDLYTYGNKELHNDIKVDCELVLLNNMDNKQ